MDLEELEDLYYKIRLNSLGLARDDLRAFAQYLHLDHNIEWFHKLVYSYLQRWIDKDIKKLAIFIPPQHGKSTMSSINAPAFILGKKPKAKVVVASYNKSVSSNFCRSTQDVMDSTEYKEIFPKSKLPSAGTERTNELRNSEYFEVVKSKGSYKAVGVNTGLTSFTIEYGIIDDPIKDRKEANSAVYREGLWDWYDNVFKTRLNNESCQLMLFTRWHNDDLAGRLFDPANEHYDEQEAKSWTVIVIPALKENEKAITNQIEIDDPRDIGKALWPDMHNQENHEADQRTNPVKFASLKQQRPSPLGGDVIKKEGFVFMGANEVPFNPDDIPMKFMVDGAFTDQTKNDPSALMAYRHYKGKNYIYNCIPVRYNMDKFMPFLKGWLMSNSYDARSTVKFEPKATGLSLISLMRMEENGGFNCERIKNVHVGWGKYTRAEYTSPSVASEKVVIIKGGWNAAFIGQCINFPNDTHDDMLDLLCYSTLEEMEIGKGRSYESSLNLKKKSNNFNQVS